MYGDAIEAWKQCMTTQERLACWASGSANEVQINIKWTILSQILPKVRYSKLLIGGRESQKSRFSTGTELSLRDNVEIDQQATFRRSEFHT